MPEHPWRLRQGPDGRTLYAQNTIEEGAGDSLVGLLDTPQLAEEVVFRWGELTRLQEIEAELNEMLESTGYQESRINISEQLRIAKNEIRALREILASAQRHLAHAEDALQDDPTRLPQIDTSRSAIRSARAVIASVPRN